MKKTALIIGVSEYEDKSFSALPGAQKDIVNMERVLQNPGVGGFDEVRRLSNPDCPTLEDALSQLFQSSAKGDLVLFYFSGHGFRDESGTLYLATRQTRCDRKGNLLRTTAIEARLVQEFMTQSKCKRQVLILDCCFSGAFAEGIMVKAVEQPIDIEAQLGGEGRAILTSSTATQYSFAEQDTSIYTRHIVEGIETGAADINRDGFITADELHQYAKRRTQEAAPKMKPEIYAVREGYTIQIAKAPKGDPKLEYRKKVEELIETSDSEKTEFGDLERMILDALQENLRITVEDAKAIEENVLQPLKERQRKIESFRQALIMAIQRETPLRSITYRRFKQLQLVLQLRNEDIEPIATQLRVDLSANDMVDSPIEYPPIINPPSAFEKQLTTFDFEVATVNDKGVINHKSRKQARLFTENLGNNTALEMVFIPDGALHMGAVHQDNAPCMLTIKIAPFLLGKYPVTQAQWEKVAALDKVSSDLNPNPSNFKGLDYPVECISWDAALEFCLRLTRHTGLPYRLPSEAEWEYACRAGTNTPFHFGETITSDLANYNGTYSYGAGPQGEYREQTTSVGYFKFANSFGLYDMHGNVWEWCEDHWHENFKDAPTNGSAWVTEGYDSLRILRGGSWSYDPVNCRSTSRSKDPCNSRHSDVGFRVAFSLTESTKEILLSRASADS